MYNSWRRWALISNCLGLAFWTAPVHAQSFYKWDDSFFTAKFERPRLPVTIDDICPFECCQIGNTWTATGTSTVVRAWPDTNARIVARLPKGHQVLSEHGRLVFSTLVPYQIPSRAQADTQFKLFPSDSVLFFTFMGEEGNALIWRQGGFALVPREKSIIPFKGADFFSPPTEKWWVRISWVEKGKRRVGWLDAYENMMEGADGCG